MHLVASRLSTCAAPRRPSGHLVLRVTSRALATSAVALAFMVPGAGADIFALTQRAADQSTDTDLGETHVSN